MTDGDDKGDAAAGAAKPDDKEKRVKIQAEGEDEAGELGEMGRKKMKRFQLPPELPRWWQAKIIQYASDSELEYEENSSSPLPVSAPSPPAKKEKSSRKRSKPAAASTSESASSARSKTKKEKIRELFGSDSEDEVDPPPPAKKQTTRKPASTGKTCSDLLKKILQAEEKASGGGSKDERRILYSSFTTRLAAGRQRRAAALGDGAFYIDVKIYNAEDALGSTPQTLYKKALVAVKLQAAEGSPPWKKLQDFVLEAYNVLKEHEPVLYKD